MTDEPEPENDRGLQASALRDALFFMRGDPGDDLELVPIGRRAMAVVRQAAPGLLPMPGQTVYPCDHDERGALQSLRLMWDWLMQDVRTVSDAGMRAVALLYCVRADLIEGMTLEAIGRLDNKTRQHVDKIVRSFAETFGFHGEMMK